MTQLSYKLTSFYQQEAYAGAICLLYTSSIIDKRDKVKIKYYFTSFFLLL